MFVIQLNTTRGSAMTTKKDGQAISVRPDKELEEAILKVANRNKISKSAVVRQVLAKALLSDGAELELVK